MLVRITAGIVGLVLAVLTVASTVRAGSGLDDPRLLGVARSDLLALGVLVCVVVVLLSKRSPSGSPPPT